MPRCTVMAFFIDTTQNPVPGLMTGVLSCCQLCEVPAGLTVPRGQWHGPQGWLRGRELQPSPGSSWAECLLVSTVLARHPGCGGAHARAGAYLGGL